MSREEIPFELAYLRNEFLKSNQNLVSTYNSIIQYEHLMEVTFSNNTATYMKSSLGLLASDLNKYLEVIYNIYKKFPHFNQNLNKFLEFDYKLSQVIYFKYNTGRLLNKSELIIIVLRIQQHFGEIITLLTNIQTAIAQGDEYLEEYDFIYTVENRFNDELDSFVSEVKRYISNILAAIDELKYLETSIAHANWKEGDAI